MARPQPPIRLLSGRPWSFHTLFSRSESSLCLTRMRRSQSCTACEGRARSRVLSVENWRRASGFPRRHYWCRRRLGRWSMIHGSSEHRRRCRRRRSRMVFLHISGIVRTRRACHASYHRRVPPLGTKVSAVTDIAVVYIFLKASLRGMDHHMATGCAARVSPGNFDRPLRRVGQQPWP